MAAQPSLLRLKLLPYAAVAAPLGLVDSAADADAGWGGAGVGAAGRVHVCLPLPISTGLPVAIDGSFEISSNRRDLWSGSDMTGDGRQRSVRVSFR